jgi:hypothetical protein
MRPDELERRLRERLDALGPAPRAELLHVLMLPDSSEPSRPTEATLAASATCPPVSVVHQSRNPTCLQ